MCGSSCLLVGCTSRRRQWQGNMCPDFFLCSSSSSQWEWFGIRAGQIALFTHLVVQGNKEPKFPGMEFFVVVVVFRQNLDVPLKAR